MKFTKILILLSLCLLFVSPVLGQANVLNYGDNVVGSISADTPLAFYTFSGAAGDLVTIQVIGVTPGLDPAVSLNAPNQQQLASNDNDPASFGQTDAGISYNLPQNGVYTVLVSSVTGAPGDFLIRLSGRQPTGAPALSEAPTTTDIQPGGQAVFFTFEANPTAAQSLNISSTPADFAFRVVVYNPEGQIIARLTGTGQMGLTLPSGTGIYTVEVSATDPTSTGQISVNLGTPPAAPAGPAGPAATLDQADQPPAAPDQTGADVCTVSVPGSNAVNVRSGPGTEFNVVTQLLPGQNLVVAGTANNWYLVNLSGGGQGWVSRDVVAESGPCAAVPTVDAPQPVVPAQTEEAAPPPQQDAPPVMPTSTPIPAVPDQQQDQAPPLPDQQAPTATPVQEVQTAPEDARFNSPLNIALDSTASVTDYVSYPGGDREDRIRWDITGMNPNSVLPGGRAKLVLSVSCFGSGTENIEFFTGGQTYSCGQTIVDKEVTYDSRTGSVTITAVGGDSTYVQWVITGTATRLE